MKIAGKGRQSIEAKPPQVPRLSLDTLPSKPGFTLVELLIAASIFSIVAVAIYSAFNSGLGAWRRGSSGSVLYQEARLALEKMSEELRAAVLYTTVEEEEEKSGFEGKADSVSFYIPLQIYTEDPSIPPEVYKISYSIKEEDDQKSLIRKRMSFVQSVQPEPESEVDELVSQAESLSFEYAYDTGDTEKPIEWKGSWEEKASLPLGIKIDLTAKDEASDEELKFTKYVFVPTGILGPKEKEEVTE